LKNDKWYVVVNPKAGSNKGKEDWPEIKELLERIERKEWLNEYLSPEEVETEFHIPISTQNKMRSNREIDYHKMKGKILYKRSDIVAYIEANKIPKIEPTRTNHRTSKFS